MARAFGRKSLASKLPELATGWCKPGGCFRVDACFTPDVSEKQAEMPPKSIRTSPGEEVRSKMECASSTLAFAGQTNNI
jgi:hypothetical protein